MTENEAIKKVEEFGLYHAIGDLPNSVLTIKAFDMAIKALEEIQQYRAIGTVEQLLDIKQNYTEALSDWRQYRKIGTIEECREARERQRAKNGTEKILIDYIISNMHWCPFKDETDNNFDNECVGFGEVGCGECILRHLDKLNR